jgi:hypothetical protein
VAANNLLEAGVLRHGQASPSHPRPPVTRLWMMACDIDDREGESPSPMEPRLGRMLPGSATGRRREHTIPEALGLCQAASPTEDTAEDRRPPGRPARPGPVLHRPGAFASPCGDPRRGAPIAKQDLPDTDGRSSPSANLETPAVVARLGNRRILHAVASALHPAICRAEATVRLRALLVANSARWCLHADC